MKNTIHSWQFVFLFAAILFLCCKKELANQQNPVLSNADKHASVSALYNPFGVFVIASASNQTLASTTDPTKQFELSYANKMLLANKMKFHTF